MAKQVICEAYEIALPGWNGTKDKPNPPEFRAADGRIYHGESVTRIPRRVPLRECMPERMCGQFKPDILARDDDGDLLIEVRVSHAVDRNKKYWARRDRLRMLEIDLSRLKPSDVDDYEVFCQKVLHESENRFWISFPEAEAAWDAEHQRLVDWIKTLAVAPTYQGPPQLDAPLVFVHVERAQVEGPASVDIGSHIWHQGLGNGTVTEKLEGQTPIYRVNFGNGNIRTVVLETNGRDRSWRIA